MALPSIVSIEAACLSAWPSVKTIYDGAWIWRFAHGYTKRSNSVQCLDPGDDGDAERRIARATVDFERHGVTPIFRVTPLAGPEITDALDHGQWVPFEESRVLAMELADAVLDVDADVRLFEPTDPAWHDAQTKLSGYSEANSAALRILLGLIAPEAKGVLVYGSDGEPAAAALAIQAGGIGIYNNVVTRADARRAGHGRALMRSALAWTRAAGATAAAIQVVSDNAPAVGLYQSLGFEEVYRYHYRRPPPGPAGNPG
jgi:GNAT superfamily N-acetyltransferase